MGSKVAQWTALWPHSSKVLSPDLVLPRPFCVEFAGFPPGAPVSSYHQKPPQEPQGDHNQDSYGDVETPPLVSNPVFLTAPATTTQINPLHPYPLDPFIPSLLTPPCFHPRTFSLTK